MKKLKTLLNNRWFFPMLLFYYGVFYIFLGETYPKKLSTDGLIFFAFVTDIKDSGYFDTYYIYRVLPSLVVRFFLKIFSVTPIVDHVLVAFQILNLICLTVSSFFFKKILQLLKVTSKNQILAFVLFLFNFAIIKYPFYIPVMTDTVAFMLSVISLYFYLKNNTIGLVICTLLFAFTWPMGYYQGLLLIALPFTITPYQAPSQWQKNALNTGAVLFILTLITLYIFIQQKDVEVYFVSKIDRTLLPLSIIGISFLFFFFAKLFFNKTLFNIDLFRKKIKLQNVLLAIGTFALVYISVLIANPIQTPLYTTEQMLRDPIVHALIWPFLNIVADTTYIGLVVCLLILFWNSFSKMVSQMGWGLVGAIALDLFLFGITPQTRHLINLLPWLIVFLVKGINKYSFSTSFYIVIGLLSIFVSKVWFVLNNFDAYPPMQLDENANMGFPQQKFWMHIGPWMSKQMYYVQGTVVVIIITILFFMLYKVTLTTEKKWLLIARFK